MTGHSRALRTWHGAQIKNAGGEAVLPLCGLGDEFVRGLEAYAYALQ
jgi:hypothetical protein